MARNGGMDDLFGAVPQTNVMASGATAPDSGLSTQDRIIGGLLPVPPGGHTPDSIREQIVVVLDAARAAETLPWSPKLVRRYTALFPYWAEWLKGGEGDRLLLEFKAEVDRLNAPADQLAPNWRERWGLAA